MIPLFFYTAYTIADLLLPDRYENKQEVQNPNPVPDFPRLAGTFTSQYLDEVLLIMPSESSISVKNYQEGGTLKALQTEERTFVSTSSSGKKYFRFDESFKQLILTDYDGSLKLFNKSKIFHKENNTTLKNLEGTYRLKNSDLDTPLGDG